MNKKISTRAGIIVGFFIFSFILLIKQTKIATDSPLVLLQFLLLFIGLLGSSFALNRYYDDVTMLDGFKHCLRTLATIMVIMVAGNTILFFLLRTGNEPLSNLTIIIGYTIFAYSISGLLSSFIASFIFNIFTKKK